MGVKESGEVPKSAFMFFRENRSVFHEVNPKKGDIMKKAALIIASLFVAFYVAIAAIDVSEPEQVLASEGIIQEERSFEQALQDRDDLIWFTMRCVIENRDYVENGHIAICELDGTFSWYYPSSQVYKDYSARLERSYGSSFFREFCMAFYRRI